MVGERAMAEACAAIREVMPGLFLVTTDFTLDAPTVVESTSFPVASLSVVLDGLGESLVPGLDTGFAPGGMGLAVGASRRPIRTRLASGRPVRVVDLAVVPDWFDGPGAADTDETLDALREAIDRPTRLVRRPAARRLLDLAGSVLAPPAGGALGRLHAEARALDLLLELVAAMVDLPGSGAVARTPGLRPRDRDRIEALLARIDADPGSTGSLARLAAESAVSVAKLKRDFRAVTGGCIGGYIASRRLILARDLLCDGLSVSEAAWRAGYDHPANFATAFRRRFGCTPSSLRGGAGSRGEA